MLVPGSLPPDVGTALAALFMLFGVPLILFGLLFLYTGYVRYDAERYLEELEAKGDETAAADGLDTASSAESVESTDDRTDR